MRARLLDDRWLQIGWYRYEQSRQYVYGHDNAFVFADCWDEEASRLALTFHKTFDPLWESGRTVTSMEDVHATRAAERATAS